MAYTVGYASPGTLNQNFSVQNPTYSVAKPVAQPTLRVVSSGGATFGTSSPQVAGQAITPSLIPGTSGGGGGGGGSTGPTAQQIADQQAAAAKAAQDAKIAQALASGSDSQLQTGLASGSAAGANYQGQAGQLYGQIAQGQNLVDNARKNIGIHQVNSIRDLMNTIRSGLQGTGVQLANSNALDSSAARAAARAYSNYGNIQTNKVNNEAATQNQDQDVAQTNLNIQKDVGLSGLKSFRDNAIASITTEAQKGLDGLKQYIALLGGDANKVNEAGIKQQILANAQAKLAAVDGYIQDHVNGLHAADPTALGQQAYAASNAGVQASGSALPFDVLGQGLAPQAQFGGAQTSLIPLAVRPKTQTA